MKKSGFTLIELIFVIVIIGVLAAVAVPKFKNLKQSAEASSVLKVAGDAIDSLPSAYVNRIDMEEDYSDSNITLSKLVKISGKNWTVSDTAGSNSDQTATYDEGSGAVAEIHFFPTDRNASLKINCGNFSDSTTKKKCWKLLNGSETNTTVSNSAISF